MPNYRAGFFPLLHLAMPCDFDALDDEATIAVYAVARTSMGWLFF